MAEHSHQLAAILFADIVGYTAMMQEDENEAVKKIKDGGGPYKVSAGHLLAFQKKNDAEAAG